jgi:SAM-dependent methyltransferase
LTTNFKLYSQYYDLLYQDKNYKAEANYVMQCIRELEPEGTSLLELGSGTGNHAIHFCDAGYHVTGIERSPDMVKRSLSKKLPNFYPVLNDITGFTLDQRFDAAVSLFHVISYLTSNAELIACFSKVAAHLNPRGIFAFDMWYGPAVLNDLPTTRIKRQQNEHVEVIRLAETAMIIEKNVAKVNYEVIVKEKPAGKYSRFLETHCMRYFSIPEIELIADQTGFTLIRSEKFMSEEKPGLHSWNVFVILQKKHTEA